MYRKHKIYLASSWRNELHQNVLETLRYCDFDVYDFRNPIPGNNGFSWKKVSEKEVKQWTFSDYLSAIEHPTAVEGFYYDRRAIENCDTIVLLMPCGNDAHLELGYAIGLGKRSVVYIPPTVEPEKYVGLMYKLADYRTDSITKLMWYIHNLCARVHVP